MPSRVYASLLRCQPSNRKGGDGDVSMPSRAVTSFLLRVYDHETSRLEKVSMPSRAVTSFLRKIKYPANYHSECVNALSGCYLISTGLQLKGKHLLHICVNARSGCYRMSTFMKSSRW